MIAMCKQLTYTLEELTKESNVELQRSLAANRQIRNELIGDTWPRILDYNRQLITDELTRRDLEGLLIT